MINDKLPGRRIRLNRQVLKTHNGDDFAKVAFVGDVHYGSPQADLKKFKEMLDYCLKNQIYVLLMGDLIELATRDSVGAGVYEQEDIATGQYEKMVELLKPLADAKLILGLLRGNHEFRCYMAVGFDISKALARELEVPYLGDACWNEFRVSKQTYSVYSLHGRTAARKDGTVLNAVENVSMSFFADLVVMGHAHRKVSGERYLELVRHSSVVQQKITTVVTGSYLRYDQSYWQTAGGQITRLGSPIVMLFTKEHQTRVSW